MVNFRGMKPAISVGIDSCSASGDSGIPGGFHLEVSIVMEVPQLDGLFHGKIWKIPI